MEATEKLYDLSMIESISGGDIGFIKTMVQLFVDTMPSHVNELKQALEQANWDMVGKHAHKMKSTIDSMGIVLLKDDIRTVEAGGKAKTNLELIPGLIDNISNTLALCIIQIKNDHGL
ncbi:MAG: Hpt domain-containing protein [Chitinophagaceae bacterium]